jgi:hypothetical protein
VTAGSINRLWDAALTRPFRLNAAGSNGQTTGREVALHVTRGLHTGATLDLAEPLYTVGSSTESDIVLRDSGIAPVHARLRRKGGQVEIEAVGGDVIVADGEIVPKGHGRRCRLPVEAIFGEAQIRLTGPEQLTPGERIPARPVLVAAGLVAAAFVLSIATNGLSLAKSDRFERPATDTKLTKVAFADGIAQYAATDAPQPEPNLAPAAPAPVSAAKAGQQLRLRLTQAGINTLGVEESHGRLIISGTLPKQQNEAWTTIQSWFDQTYGGHVLLVSDVVAAGVEQTPRIPLQAIWYGQRPYIVTADGARYYEGAFVNDGWTIKKIGEKELLLAKGGSTVALKYP